MSSMTYTREKLATLEPTADKSLQYWRKQAAELFARRPDIETVEVVRGGCKTSSRYVPRGVRCPPPGVAVILASTGGKWGRSRSDYLPREPSAAARRAQAATVTP
jgi:hypothetical protein